MKKCFVIILSILVAIFASGCGPATYGELVKYEGTKKKEFVINKNYQKLYKDTLDATGRCWDSPAYTIYGTEYTHKREFYNELGEARIERYIASGLIFSSFDFKSIDTNKTKLTIHVGDTHDPYFVTRDIDVMKKEITGECIKCRCKE